MTGWELAIGLYPGILIGARSYPEQKFTEHVIYLPFVEFIITVYYPSSNKFQEDMKTRKEN